jgi:hydroxymethylpyrimidine pyrophosphatase-like HAD family hydrolase
MSRSPKKTTSLLKISAPKSAPKVKLVCTDFDGTLIGGESESALAEFFEIMKEQRRLHKVKWIINTGRSWDTLEPEMIARGFPLLPDWVVLSEREVYRIHREHPVGDYEWNRACTETHEALFAQTAPFWKELEEFISSQTGAEMLEDEFSPITLRARNEHEAKRIHKFVDETLPKYPCLVLVRNDVYFRFAHETYHKGTCLQRIQAEIGLEPAHTFAAGDHYNDLPMLNTAYAKYLACPGNAIPEVQHCVTSQAGRHAPGHAAAGVVEAWKSFLS